MDSHKSDHVDEVQLLALLATLKAEATPEANFEERFLYDFHDRIVRETVCCPAHRRVWEHLLQILTNFGKKRLVWGASTLGVGVLAMGIMIDPSSDDISDARVQVAKRFDDTVSSLVPGLSRDCDGCTSVWVRGDSDEGQSAVLSASRVQRLMDFPVDDVLYAAPENSSHFFSSGLFSPF